MRCPTWTHFSALCALARNRGMFKGASSIQNRTAFWHLTKAFDESGEGKHLKATRLYIYPDEPSRTLHVITLGDKSTQDTDIRLASAFVEGLLDFSENEPDAED